MKTLLIYGASDDLIYFEGIPDGDEFNIYNADDNLVHGEFEIVSNEGRLRIYPIYDGCWMFAIGQVWDLSNTYPLPNWPIVVTQHSEIRHSVLVTIQVPDDATLLRCSVDGEGGEE